MTTDSQEQYDRHERDGPEMSISDHLNELRSRLIRALLGVAIILIGCLFYQDEIMQIITRPHRQAMERLEEEIAEKSENSKEGEPTRAEKIQAAIEKLKEDDPRKALLETIAQEVAKSVTEPARARHIQAAIEKLREEDPRDVLLELLAEETAEIVDSEKQRRGRLQAIKYQEAFVSYLKASIVAALLLASPWVLLQLWGFVGAGLYQREKRYILLYLPFSFLAFGCGVLFGYFVLIPEGLSYLARYADPSLVAFNVTLEFYLSLFLLLTLALGLVFQLPLVMMFLARVGVFTPRDYAKHRRYFLLAAVILGAVLTPPDPVTQVLLAAPMFLLYELGIWLSRITARRQKEA